MDDVIAIVKTAEDSKFLHTLGTLFPSFKDRFLFTSALVTMICSTKYYVVHEG